MSTDVIPETEADLQLREAVDRLSKGIRDPQAAREAAARMRRMTEEMRLRTGNVEMAVDLIRDARNP